jgi:hypothetical protein
MDGGLTILPIEDGEGDHPKGGGGVTGTGLGKYPSTMLRMVPLPMLRMGRIN